MSREWERHVDLDPKGFPLEVETSCSLVESPNSLGIDWLIRYYNGVVLIVDVRDVVVPSEVAERENVGTEVSSKV